MPRLETPHLQMAVFQTGGTVASGKRERRRKVFNVSFLRLFSLLFSSASGCPLASKNKALREQLSGNIKYGNGSSTTFGNRLAALSSSGNTYDPESLSQEKTSPGNDTNDEKVRKIFSP